MTSETIIAKRFVHVGSNADTSSGSTWQITKGNTEHVLIRTVRAGVTKDTCSALNKKLRGEVFAKGNSSGRVKSSTD